MKIHKISIIITILFFTLSSTLPTLAATTAYDKLGIASATINTKNGKYVSGQNQNTVLPLASLTKLMTALVLVDLKTNLQEKVIISQAEIDYTIAYIEPGDKTSSINIKAGDKVTKNDLWYAMLIASSNEAAIALVDNSGLSRQQFVKKMNTKARALGLVHTKFTDPSGIDPNNIGTAREMAIISRLAYSNSLIRLASISPSYKIKEVETGRAIGVYSRNNSLLAMKPLGMKVGYLTEAKDNCAIRLNQKSNDRIVVVLHALTNAQRNKEINRLMAK